MKTKLRSALTREIDKVGKKKKALKRLAWADKVGGELLEVLGSNDDDEVTVAASGKGSSRERKVALIDDHQSGLLRVAFRGSTSGRVSREEGDGNNCYRLDRGSYKEALLRRLRSHPLHTPKASPPKLPPTARGAFLTVLENRPPSIQLWGKSVRKVAEINRAAHHRGRVPLGKVYVPYSEEYLRQVELRRNAILADVIQQANLGPDPITSIKSALASRFGMYTDDFAVARCRDRDFAIFLPEWVLTTVLTRRKILTLNGFWLRCFPWGNYRNARPYCAICLINLPFEIWIVARVAALVSGFGRFIKADDVTKAMADLHAYRCQIAFDSLSSIPQNLSVILGEELFSIMVHLESWERIEEARVEAPPAPPRNEHDDAEAPAGDRHANGMQEQADEEMEGEAGELEEVEPPPSTHRGLRGTKTRRAAMAVHQFATAARVRAAYGRRAWVAMSRNGGGFETKGTSESRQAEKSGIFKVSTKKNKCWSWCRESLSSSPASIYGFSFCLSTARGLTSGERQH
uniref:DUF4283 domain-containing protein n=1 Tax=Ananas comosus var. bracteatus TaxID=296719 RepID=A0A6V7NSK0_ANACO|nr:unnamed protein product [Ananas comosus var. bracteatus]